MSFTIYALSSSSEPTHFRYVGQTKQPIQTRLSEHKSKAKVEKHHRACWIRHELQNGHEILITVLDEATEVDWQLKERHYIKFLKSCGAKLVNGTEGGEIGWGGRKHRAESIEKMRASKRGKKRGPMSEQTKEKLRQAAYKQFETIKPCGMKDKNHTTETKTKISHALLAYRQRKKANALAMCCAILAVYWNFITPFIV